MAIKEWGLMNFHFFDHDNWIGFTKAQWIFSFSERKNFQLQKKRLQIQFVFVFLFLVVVFVVVVYCLFTGWFIRNHSEKNLFFHFDGTEKNSWFMGSPDSIWWPIVFVAVVVVWDVLSVFCWILSIIVVVFRYRSIIGRPNIYTINFHFSSHLTITELFILICIFFCFQNSRSVRFSNKEKIFQSSFTCVCVLNFCISEI